MDFRPNLNLSATVLCILVHQTGGRAGASLRGLLCWISLLSKTSRPSSIHPPVSSISPGTPISLYLVVIERAPAPS